MITVAHPTRPGYQYEIMELTYGRGRIILTNGVTVDDGW